MKVLKFIHEEDWHAARRGKITGTRLKDITVKKRGSGLKVGFYELIAERLAVPRDGEDPMARGTRLESEAIQAFKDDTGLELDTSLMIWMRDDDENIAISPDAVVVDKPWAVESKCLSSAAHIEAYLTQEIPDEYLLQALQYFIVNDELQKLFFVFYDPNLSVKQYFYIEVNRDQEKVDEYLALERQVLADVRNIVTELSF